MQPHLFIFILWPIAYFYFHSCCNVSFWVMFKNKHNKHGTSKLKKLNTGEKWALPRSRKIIDSSLKKFTLILKSPYLKNASWKKAPLTTIVKKCPDQDAQKVALIIKKEPFIKKHSDTHTNSPLPLFSYEIKNLDFRLTFTKIAPSAHFSQVTITIGLQYWRLYI